MSVCGYCNIARVTRNIHRSCLCVARQRTYLTPRVISPTLHGSRSGDTTNAVIRQRNTRQHRRKSERHIRRCRSVCGSSGLSGCEQSCASTKNSDLTGRSVDCCRVGVSACKCECALAVRSWRCKRETWAICGVTRPRQAEFSENRQG